MEVSPNPPIHVKEIVIHSNPDLDAICSYMIARYIAPSLFPGIKKAPISFVSQGPPPNGKTAEELEKEGYLAFDVWEGRFDHHPHDKLQEKSASQLVAEYCGVEDDPALIKLLAYVQLHDLEGPTSLSRNLEQRRVDPKLVEKVRLLEAHQLSAVLPILIESSPNEEKRVKRMSNILYRLYQVRRRFFKEVAEEYKAKARIWEVESDFGRLKIATIESDVREVGNFSRTKQGGYCHLCIHRMPSTGYAFISGNIPSEAFLEIGKFLRVAEMRKRNPQQDYLPSELELSKMPACPVWYLPRNIEGKVFVIVNGGEKAPDVEPTKLSTDEIEECVKNGLRSSKIVVKWPQCPHSHCILTECALYPYGLLPCKEIRGHPA